MYSACAERTVTAGRQRKQTSRRTELEGSKGFLFVVEQRDAARMGPKASPVSAIMRVPADHNATSRPSLSRRRGPWGQQGSSFRGSSSAPLFRLDWPRALPKTYRRNTDLQTLFPSQSRRKSCSSRRPRRPRRPRRAPRPDPARRCILSCSSAKKKQLFTPPSTAAGAPVLMLWPAVYPPPPLRSAFALP